MLHSSRSIIIHNNKKRLKQLSSDVPLSKTSDEATPENIEFPIAHRKQFKRNISLYADHVSIFVEIK